MARFDEKDNDATIEAEIQARRQGLPQPQSAFWGNPFVRIAIFWLIYLAVMYAVRYAIEVVQANTIGFRQVRPNSPASVFDFFTFPVASTIAVFAALWLMRRSEGIALWRSTGFVRQGAGMCLGLGLLVGVVVQVIGAGISLIFWHYAPLERSPTSLFLQFVLYNLAANCLRGVNIEVILRGFIFQEFERRWGTLAAFIGSTSLNWLYLLWARVYLALQYGDIHGVEVLMPVLYQLLWAISGGLLFTGAYLVYRNLWLPIGIHLGIIAGVWIGNALGMPALTTFPAALVEIIAGGWLVYLAIKKGQWIVGPGPREIALAGVAGVVRIVEMTDPGKEVDKKERRNTRTSPRA